MSTAYLSRALQALLQPLQGSFSSGKMLSYSTQSTGTIAAGSILCPVVSGSEMDSAIVKVDKNPDTTDGSWPITSAGAQVSVSSIQGGIHVNLPAGTPLRFDDPDAGVAPEAVLATDLTGGTRREDFAALRQVRSYKDLGSQIDARSFFAAQLGEYPAAVLSWNATTPGDGSASPSLDQDGSRLGNGKRIYCHEWTIFVISTRYDSTEKRKREGDTLRDRILGALTDRTAFRDLVLSGPGVKVLDARLAATSPTAYVDTVKFCTWFVLSKTDERTFNDWKKSTVESTRETSAGPVKPVTGFGFSMV